MSYLIQYLSYVHTVFGFQLLMTHSVLNSTKIKTTPNLNFKTNMTSSIMTSYSDTFYKKVFLNDFHVESRRSASCCRTACLNKYSNSVVWVSAFGFLPLILALEFRHSLFSGHNCCIILPWFLDLSHQHSKLRPRRISHQLFRWYFGVLYLIDYNTWGMKKPYFFHVRPLLPCFVPTANGKAEDDDENNINITLMSSQNCKMCSKYCCHATRCCLGWNTNMADKVGYHDDIEIWSRECIRSIWATPK